MRRQAFPRRKCSICNHAMIPVEGETSHPACGGLEGEVYGVSYGTVARDAGISAAATADPDGHRTAVGIIRAAAREHEVLSANTVRAAMQTAGVPNKLGGGAWRAAVQAGYVKPGGYVPSTSASTNAHKIVEYQSLIYVRRAA